MKRSGIKRYVNSLVVIAALGYFVDIYDLILFSIVRIPSLKALGLSGSDLFNTGVMLLNAQMAGMLIGGIFWGILGDRKGRVSVLFGSILLYSLANIANGMVHSIPAYAVWRFIAGVGLAGELGAGITLVAETLPKETRGWGTMIIASVGISGAVLAGAVAQVFDWRVAYFIGGALGIGLLFLRMSAFESGMYTSIENQDSKKRGNFFALFTSARRFSKYLKCIIIGLPTWFVIGILITFSPEFAKAMGLSFEVSAGQAVMWAYGGLVLGDILSGVLSQVWRSRRVVVLFFLALTISATSIYLSMPYSGPLSFYLMCGALGLSVGYWAIFVTIAAEQFGTNLRATVATTVPNFIRGSIIPLTALFAYSKGTIGILKGGLALGLGCVALAAWAVFLMEETFGKELNYTE